MSKWDRIFGKKYTCDSCGATTRNNYKGWKSQFDGAEIIRACPDCKIRDATDRKAQLVSEDEETKVKVYRGVHPPDHWPEDVKRKMGY